jgi:phenylacetate-CoA ligase
MSEAPPQAAAAGTEDLGASLARDASLLAEELAYVAHRSNFYADRWSADQRAVVRSCAAAEAPEYLTGLPLTTKDDLRRSQEAAPPFGIHLACDPAEVALVHRTSGTTGRPLVVAATAEDIEITSRHGARAFACAGLRPDDVVVHCLNYCMWAGGYTDHRCLEATGAAVVPYGVGSTDELLSLQRWLPFSALSSTPSYVRLLLERLSGEDLELWRRNVRLFLVGGEPGGSEDALRRKVREHLGAEIVNANYGLAEVLSNFGSECGEAQGMHFHGHGAIWLELLDEDGRSLPLTAGARGEIVLTHLQRRAQPLVRYQTNDVMEILDTDPCACGRTSFRFQLHGRADDMFVVRGINVFPGAVARALNEVSPELTEFAILLPSSETFDRIPLLVEATANSPADTGDLIQNAIKRLIGCGSEVTILESGSLPRTQGKTRRLYRDGAAPSLSSSTSI